MRTRDVDMTASAQAVRARRKRVNNEAGDPGTRQKGVGSHARDVEVGSESGSDTDRRSAFRRSASGETPNPRRDDPGRGSRINRSPERKTPKSRKTAPDHRPQIEDENRRQVDTHREKEGTRQKKPRPLVIRQPRDRENNFISPEAGVLRSP